MQSLLDVQAFRRFVFIRYDKFPRGAPQPRPSVPVAHMNAQDPKPDQRADDAARLEAALERIARAPRLSGGASDAPQAAPAAVAAASVAAASGAASPVASDIELIAARLDRLIDELRELLRAG